MAKMELHDFYCLKCGKKGISLLRPRGHKHARLHRKKLYCPHCKETLNAVEISNQEEYFEFREDFENGVFVNEAEDSCAACRNPW